MEIYERLKYLRKDVLHLTQADFSSSINISRSNIGNIEIGRIALTDRVISDICEKFNVREEWLRSGVGEIFSPLLVEDEVAGYVSELLESDNPFTDLIIEVMRTYSQLDPASQEVLKDFSGKLLKNIRSKKED